MNHPLKKDAMSQKGAYRGSGFPTYVRRLMKFRQMDLEYTFWQMYLMCTNPKVVYRHTMYRKQTKNQWARDDPAFVVLTAIMVFAVSILYCLFYSRSLGQAAYAVVRSVLVDFLGVGAGVATAYWYVANRYMREGVNHSHAVEQRVEWMYAFDVHVNAFFTLFVSLYCGQLVLSPILTMNGFLPRLLSGALYGVALSYYHYCVFCGYNVLPFLEHTALLVYPIALIMLVTPLAILVGFNPTKFVLGIYFH